MKLTLGQASKEAGISKPSLSAAIKKGRLSAVKNESGYYEIDPAELFRVYPAKTNTNTKNEQAAVTAANPSKSGGDGASDEVLALLLAERDTLIEEKNASIKRLEEEKGALREDLDDQKDQTKRMTLLLENKSQDTNKEDKWQETIKAIELRVANQETKAKEEGERAQKILRQNQALKKALDEEKNKSFWQKLFV
jgi:hypothetical protein